MSNKKPRIYAHCDADCKWETIHRSDFENAYPYAPVLLNADGSFNIEIGRKYKIFKKDEYTDKYGFSFRINFSNGNGITINIDLFDKHRNYVYFKLLSVERNQNYETIVSYEINDTRYEKVSRLGLYNVRIYSCFFNSTDGSVYGSGETYFSCEYEETPTTQRKEIRLTTAYTDGVYYLTYENIDETLQEEIAHRYPIGLIAGDQKFVEELSTYVDIQDSDKHFFRSIKWKETYTDENGLTYTTSNVNGTYTSEYNADATKHVEISYATYTCGNHYVITSYSWNEIGVGYTLVNQEVNDDEYIAYYVSGSTDAATFTIDCIDSSHAYILNDEKTTMIGNVADTNSEGKELATKEYVDNNAGGSGLKIIDIEELDTIPSEYQDAEKLTNCLLRDEACIYHLSFFDDSDFYFENIDEGTYRYIYISSNDWAIERQGKKQLATTEYVDNAIGSALQGDY